MYVCIHFFFFLPRGFFPKGIPRAVNLKKDLEKANLPYQDQQGRFADFHALRYTFATFLQRNGVNPRIAMKLMRHSDLKLTSKVYVDESGLPVVETVKSLPNLPTKEGSHIGAQIPDSASQFVSETGNFIDSSNQAEVLESKHDSPELSGSVGGCLGKKMERVKRFELSTSTLARLRSTN